MSVEAENKALEIFSKLEHHTEDVEWKEGFSKLAEQEHLQNRILYDEFYSINNQVGEYRWGD